jgi:molybdopterin molybdotransferase
MSEQYKSTEMISVEDARQTMLDGTTLLPPESVEIPLSIGRVLAQDVASDIDIAPFDNSAMDGFALRMGDFANAEAVDDANPLTLNIVGVLGAGSVYAGEVGPGQALRIMTGAPMPAGADTVVKIEDALVLGESEATPFGTQVVLTSAPKLGANVRLHGEEARKGDVLLRAGEVLSMAGVGMLASTGHAEVEVYSRPRVAILSTGSELVAMTEVPGPGQIRNSNSPALAAAVIDAGGTPAILSHVEDTREALTAALGAAAKNYDFIVLSGGAAEGDFDYTAPVIRELGTVAFTKVNMRPGKAQIYGAIGSTQVFGLPGNPAAAAVGFEILVRPALRKMQGFTALERPITSAIITSTVNKREPRRQYMRASLSREQDGNLTITPSSNQSSALFSALHQSNCLLIIPEGLDPVNAGDTVSCLRTDLPEGAVQ